MTLLILGLLLWTAAHYFKRLAPGARASLNDKMGDASKGVFAVAIVLSIVLMVLGHRAMDFVPVWNPPSFMGHLNNLLMLLAFYIYGSSAAKGEKVWIATKIRHPQLTAVKVWALAHLLANGDLSSIVLFGGLLAWAVGSVILINRAEGPWTPLPQAGKAREIRLVVITLVLYALVSAIHIWLGVNPFGGV